MRREYARRRVATTQLPGARGRAHCLLFALKAVLDSDAMPARDRTKRRVAPRQARAHASIDAILEATEILLREKGYARTTTNRIAERAGVNVALVYRYFAGKEAIVGALIERAAGTTEESVRKVLAENAHNPLPVALRALLETLVHTPGDPVVHRELFEHVDATRRRQNLHDLRARIAALFADFMARRRAELRPLADHDATMFVLQHAIEAATHAAAFYRPGGLSLERALDALADIVSRGLLPATASAADASPAARAGAPTGAASRRVRARA